MLVLSRSVNQSIVIDESVELHIRAVTSDSVDLVIVGLPGEDLHRHTIQLNQSVNVCDDVIVTLIQVRDGKARLGIDAPRETSIHRGEFTGE